MHWLFELLSLSPDRTTQVIGQNYYLYRGTFLRLGVCRAGPVIAGFPLRANNHETPPRNSMREEGGEETTS
jgi:hypothetical protein